MTIYRINVTFEEVENFGEEGERFDIQDLYAYGPFETEAEAMRLGSLFQSGQLVSVLRSALADLYGIMPEFEPGGDRTHPGWETIEELRGALALLGSNRSIYDEYPTAVPLQDPADRSVNCRYCGRLFDERESLGPGPDGAGETCLNCEDFQQADFAASARKYLPHTWRVSLETALAASTGTNFTLQDWLVNGAWSNLLSRPELLDQRILLDWLDEQAGDRYLASVKVVDQELVVTIQEAGHEAV